MNITINELNNKEYKNNKRVNQKQYNYLHTDRIDKLQFEEVPNRYKNYDKQLENTKLYKDTKQDIWYIDIDGIKILLRDKIEKSYFFNKFLMIEYIDEKVKNEKLTIKQYITKSNFYKLEGYQYLVLDIDTDYITKTK